jgi:hypothetical protein
VVTDIAASWQPSSSARWVGIARTAQSSTNYVPVSRRGGISVFASYPPTNNILGKQNLEFRCDTVLIGTHRSRLQAVSMKLLSPDWLRNCRTEN